MRVSKVLTLGTSPSTLADVEATANSSAVRLASLSIYKPLLCLNDCARLSLVVHTEHLASDLELAALARRRNWLEKLELTLPVEDMLGVEFGDTSDRLGVRASVEVNYFLIGVLEGQNDGVCGECCELRMQFLP